jgi:hypothetical protein
MGVSVLSLVNVFVIILVLVDVSEKTSPTFLAGIINVPGIDCCDISKSI